LKGTLTSEWNHALKLGFGVLFRSTSFLVAFNSARVRALAKEDDLDGDIITEKREEMLAFIL
jgi:hypothetical protein